MDFNLLSSQLWVQLLWGLVSIVGVELVRDVYHLAGHYWQPLQRFHLLHHKAYRRDLTITSLEAYKKAQRYNDIPESFVMVSVAALAAILIQNVGIWLGCLYSLAFLIPAIARSQGLLLQTDLTHKPGALVEIPSLWTVNRTYHWRHHFDESNAYFSGHSTLLDKMLGTSLSVKEKVIAITGASGTLGQALIEELALQGAKVVALTTNQNANFQPGVEVLHWQIGAEADLVSRLKKVDILVINHGINVYGDRSAAAVFTSYEVNTFSTLQLAELFLATVTTSADRATKELWINTSEAEVNPAFSPLYELSKRTLGDLITLRRLDAPCIIRKLVLGPFKSQLNPYGVMSARWIAWAIVALAKRDFRNIVITVNPLTYLAFPVKEFFQSLYFRLFTSNRSNQ
ncbi:MAG: bifunctional sterol desaturase/short chain dehydrogenase [Cyanobacteria bacterium RM1_2_2]|nr:bifunctional sterol desaturase/short chain dehydrogenase [Cyanobacteria bacterium RM1_2_2]